jgi:predicted glycoside hydrolase/deacetylase ChbG (UPF0249 family)
MTSRLIVNADDYGRTPGISQGILTAHRAGIVTSTTVMINQPGIATQMQEALAYPDLGVGLHLVFSTGHPVLSPGTIPGLVDADGQFLDQHTLWSRANHIPLDQLRAELTAQIERFADLAGHLPDHLDCHHFVHLYPPFFQVYTDLAHRYHLPLRVPFPPETDFGTALKTLPYLEGFPRDLVRGMIVTNSARLRTREAAYPDHFIATFFGRDALTLDYLISLLDCLPKGISELMCHPGLNDPGLASSTYRDEREMELALLTHPSVRKRVKDREIELVTFRLLGNRPDSRHPVG